MISMQMRLILWVMWSKESEMSGKGLNGTWGSVTYLTYRFDRQAPGFRTTELPARVWDGKGASCADLAGQSWDERIQGGLGRRVEEAASLGVAPRGRMAEALHDWPSRAHHRNRVKRWASPPGDNSTAVGVFACDSPRQPCCPSKPRSASWVAFTSQLCCG
jgi:hypothetical protein